MIWVGQFGVEGGEAREATPWVGAYPDPGRSDEPSDLYVLVEPALPGSEEFCGEMKDAIGEVFHREKASQTGGILRALHSAHESLRDWNRRSLREHRVAAGVSCAAVQDGTAYVGQVAPAAAVFWRPDATDPELVTPALPEAADPLGLDDDFRPDFRRFEMTDGDRLLLLSPALAEALAGPAGRTAVWADLAAVLALPPEDALPELYRRARGIENCAALLIAAVPNPEPEH